MRSNPHGGSKLLLWVSAFVLTLAATILNALAGCETDLLAHSDIFSSAPSGSAHLEHDSLIFKNSLLSEESSFSADPSLFASFGHEDHSLYGDSLADKPNGLHLGWGTGVKHNHPHHYDGGPTNGNIDLPTDPVAEPEPSTTVSLLSGLAIVLFFSSRKRVSA